jgi:hypothetical protein
VLADKPDDERLDVLAPCLGKAAVVVAPLRRQIRGELVDASI